MTASAPSLSPGERIFVAVDIANLDAAKILVSKLVQSNNGTARLGGIKLGLEFFCAHGPAGIAALADHDLPIFLDLKLHDIPNTVAGAVRAAMQVRPRFITLHSSGGPAMIRAAADAAKEEADRQNCPSPALLAVTVLTSLDSADLDAVGQDHDITRQVIRLAGMACQNGASGIVCAPFEVGFLRETLGASLITMVPGVRPTWAAQDDQKRVMTPTEAIRHGADYLVIGRPITQTADPIAALDRIVSEIDQDLAA